MKRSGATVRIGGLLAALLAVLLVPVVTGAQSVHTPTYKIVLRFTGFADGSTNHGSLTEDATGNIYGTSGGGGKYGHGYVFKLFRNGNEVKYSLGKTDADGVAPDAGVTLDKAGNLYGTTLGGGDLNCGVQGGCGTVFKLDRTGKQTVLHRFTDGADEGGPLGGVVRDALGNLYGTTFVFAGQAGTVYKLDKSNHITELYTFSGGA